MRSTSCGSSPGTGRALSRLTARWIHFSITGMTRRPLGPCHHGIGTLFLQVEYPFLRYNLVFYIYVLSCFERAKRDKRFKAALAALESKLTEKGEVIVERPHRGLKGLEFCAKGQPSALATARYREIQQNLAG
jgi:hypothetical protein